MKFENLEPPVRTTDRSVKMRAGENKNGIMIYLSVPQEFLSGNHKFYRIGYAAENGVVSVKLTPDAECGFSARLLPRRGDGEGKTGTYIFRLGETPFAPDCAQGSTPCQYELTADEMIITAPVWCFAGFGEGEAA